MFKESADNEHRKRTSFSSQRRKTRDRAYATTIIEARRNVRTYRYIIARGVGEKEKNTVSTCPKTVRTPAASRAVEGKGAHLDNRLINSYSSRFLDLL